MGMSARRRREYEAERVRLESIMPVELRQLFDEDDIELTWIFLHKVFHLNTAKWKQVFEDEFLKASREFSRTEIFARFGRKYFEPSLKRILFREEDDETWFIILQHIVRKKLADRKRESRF